MAIYNFGSGTLWGTRSDVANSTPVKFGALQSVDMEFTASAKQLYGQNQFPLAVARGTGKITGKAKLGQIQARTFADLFFGTSLVTGQVTTANGESGVIPSTPFQLTASNGATFVADLGVINSATGIPLTKVSSAPATGQYSVNTTGGVYTFAAADVGNTVSISYTYSVSASGQKLVFSNPQLGIQPTFSCALETVYTAPGGLKKAVLNLNACISNKLSFPTKLEDFTIPEFDFECFADSAGNIFTWSFNENS